MKCWWNKSSSLAVACVAVLCFYAFPAFANNVCVSCDGPSAVYSCSYAPDADGNTPSRSPRSMQFVCIQDVAQRYQHSSCRVNSNQTGACNGLVHMIPQNAAAAPSSSVPSNETATPAPAAVPKKKREPKTVVEMAKRTAESTKKQIKKSARKVSKAAKSTWRCVTTLFSKC